MNGLANRAYDELAAYLKEMGDDGAPFERKAREATFYRKLNHAVTRLSFGLKYGATYGLALSLAYVAAKLIKPTALPGLERLASALLAASILTKVFGPLVDLETRRVQYVMILLVGGLFWLTAPLTRPTTLGMTVFFAVLVTASRYAKRNMKLGVLRLMVHDPQAFAGHLRTENAGLLKRHAELGIRLFDDPVYCRSFELRKSKKRREAVPKTTDHPRDNLPPAGTVRVEVWQRDPLRDLSCIREFFVCCFLGGSQDASAFDFMMSKSLTMLDFVCAKGRTLRALLMACVTREDGREVPVLVVNAVFGREGGLVGSVRDDNTFVKQQIEAYARFAGFERVLYHLAPANKRPRLFVQYVKEQMHEPATRLKCRLTSTRDPIKLEVFNRREPCANAYLMHLLDIMNATNNYATGGTVRGHPAVVRDPFMTFSFLTDDRAPAKRHIDIDAGGCYLRLDCRLAGEATVAILRGFLTEFPELDTAGLPHTVNVELLCVGRQLVGGSALDGVVRIHPAIERIVDDFWRETLFATAFCQHFLWLLHPSIQGQGDDPFVFPLLARRLPDLYDRVIGSLPDLYAMRHDLSIQPGSGDLITKLMTNAVRERYDASRVFKFRHIYAAIHDEEMPAYKRGKTQEMAEEVFYRKWGESEGFREKFLRGLSSDQRHLVQDEMVRQISEMVDHLRVPETVTLDFPLRDHRQIEERVRGFEKTVNKYGIELVEEDAHRLEALKLRVSLLARLDQIDNMIDNRKAAQAIVALRDLRRTKGAELSRLGVTGRVTQLRRKAMFAPLQELVDRLNMDQHW